MRSHFLALPLALVALSSFLVSPALAQRWQGPSGEPSEEAMEEARALYEQGSQAAEEQRWSDAIDLFELSYATSGASVALFSLGYTLRAVGRFRDARDVFDQLLSDEDIDPELFTQATDLRAEVAPKIAILTLAGLDSYEAPDIEVDGSTAEDDGERPLALEINPGDHHVRVEAHDYTAFSWEGRLAPGDRLSLDVVLERAGSSIFASPWLWVGVGAAVVLAVVITAVVLQSSAQLDPRTENHLAL